MRILSIFYLFFFLDDIYVCRVYICFGLFFPRVGIGSFMFPLGFITNVCTTLAPRTIYVSTDSVSTVCDHSPNAPVRENYDEHIIIIIETVVGFVCMFLI